MRWEEDFIEIETTEHPLPEEILTAIGLLRETVYRVEYVNLNRKRLDAHGKLSKSYEKFARLIEIDDSDEVDAIAAAIVAAALEADQKDGTRATGKYQIKIGYREADENSPIELTSAVFALADAKAGARAKPSGTEGASSFEELARRTVSGALSNLERALKEAQRTSQEQQRQLEAKDATWSAKLSDNDKAWLARWEEREKRFDREREAIDKRIGELTKERETLTSKMVELAEKGLRPTLEMTDLTMGIAASGLAMMEATAKERAELARQTADDAKGERRAELADKAIDRVADMAEMLAAAKFGPLAKRKKKPTKGREKENVKTEKKEEQKEETQAEGGTIDPERVAEYDAEIAKLAKQLFGAMGQDEAGDDWEIVQKVYGDDTRDRMREIADDKKQWTLATIKAFVDEEITCEFDEGPNMVKRLMTVYQKMSAEAVTALKAFFDVLQKYETETNPDDEED